ncbi:NUDIX domain-containing protein [Asanoa hainanensis]|uniref:NUDIX domain-containing protein n=1 Tax=Asanoa hainanensis TaxID=560556 RepID=A0A239MDQ1_9ACTN|nr:NUDIX domain-containing protein [Asanoa hainanensis]SNT41127.1 NUDIX domain-containing protein [Asanoa hainanensis]
MRSARHFTAAAIILDDRDRVLLVSHHKIGLWIYPGGHLEADEDPVEGVVREVREETGLRVEVIRAKSFEHPAIRVIPPPFAILDIDMNAPSSEAHRHIELVYVCRPLRGTLTPRLAEVGECRWVPALEVGRLETPTELPDLVLAAVNWVHAADL